jgi:hypothetical protein
VIEEHPKPVIQLRFCHIKGERSNHYDFLVMEMAKINLICFFHLMILPHICRLCKKKRGKMMTVNVEMKRVWK